MRQCNRITMPLYLGSIRSLDYIPHNINQLHILFTIFPATENRQKLIYQCFEKKTYRTKERKKVNKNKTKIGE